MNNKYLSVGWAMAKFISTYQEIMSSLKEPCVWKEISEETHHNIIENLLLLILRLWIYIPHFSFSFDLSQHTLCCSTHMYVSQIWVKRETYRKHSAWKEVLESTRTITQLLSYNTICSGVARYFSYNYSFFRLVFLMLNSGQHGCQVTKCLQPFSTHS